MSNVQPRSHLPHREPDPTAVDRWIKAEMGYLVVSVAVLIVLLFSARLIWAVIWFMATLFMFGIWRIAKGQFK